MKSVCTSAACAALLFLLCQVSSAQGVPVSVKEFLRKGDDDKTVYVIKGVVHRIRNFEKGNLYLRDKSGEVLIYGMKDSLGRAFPKMDIRRGDTLTLSGRRHVYAKSVIEMKNAFLVAKIDGKGHSDMPVHADMYRKPVFKGKDVEAFRQWVQERIVCPPQWHGTDTVSVKFVVGRNGGVQEVEVAPGPPEELLREAERVVKSSPKWKCATVDGKPVRITYKIPVVFSANN